MKAVKRHNRSAFTTGKLLTRRVRVIFLSALTLSLTITALYLASPPPARAASTTIVISQIYGGGGDTGAPYKNDFIELYNLGTTTVNLNGWSVQYANTGSATWSVTNLSGSLAPGRYYLIQEDSSGSNGTTLPAPSVADTINMSATDGKVALVSNTTPLTGTCPSNGSIVDFVGYGTGGNATDCFEGTGPAPTLSNTTADIRNNGGSQDTDNNDVDFIAAAPFPRSGAFNATSSIAVDASSQSCQFFDLLAEPSFSWQHTVGSGSNRILMVGVSTETVSPAPALIPVGVAAARVLSVTLTNGANVIPLTRVDDTLARDATNQTQVEMFRLLEAQMPGPGAYTITVTLTLPNATSVYAVGGAVSFFGVDQTAPFNTGQTSSLNNTFARSTGNSASPSLTVASGSNEYVIDTVSSVYTGGGAAVLSTANPLQTERWNGAKSSCFTNVQDSIGAGSTRPGASPDVIMQWSINTPQPWAIGAVSLRPASTLVELASFEASKVESGVALRWRTGFEVNNLGFNLYRERKGKRVQVNPSIIAGSALLIGQGGAMTAGDSYSWFDPQGTSDSVYYLEDIDLDGTRKLHGPAVPVLSSSASISAGQRQAMLLSELNAQAASISAVSKWQKGWPASTDSPRELLYRIDGRPGVNLQQMIASQGAVKLSVTKEGWYRVTQADLVAAGFKENVDARMLQLYSNGAEVPILMNAAKQQFSQGDSFEFYGTELDTPTTDANTYWLIAGNGKGLRINRAPRTSTSVNLVTSPSRSQNGTGQGQGIQARPSSTQPRQANTVNPQNLFIFVPMIIPSMPKDIVVTPKRGGNGAKKEAAPTATPSVNNSEDTARPQKKNKKKKARGRNARHKASSRHHAMLRPVAAQSYPYTVELKERLIYISSLINGEKENFYGKVIGSGVVSQQLILENLNLSSSAAHLEIALQGYTLTSHQVKVKVNSQEVGALSFRGQEHAVAHLSVPTSSLLEGENTITLERAGGETDVSFVDYIRLTYEHSYRADTNAIRFTADGITQLDGFTNSQIRVVDISDPRRIKEVACTVDATSNGYAATIQTLGGNEYMAFTEDAITRPASIERDAPSNLMSNDNGADFIIISHRDFINSVQPLAELRRKQGLIVMVVDVQDVYDEFSSGAHSPYAIKDFLAWAKTRWQKAPEFVLLAGDASLDPRNHLGNGVTDFVPTKLVDASAMETASDDWLVDFDRDGMAEMAIGRLPVRTVTEADRVISKIVSYTPGSVSQEVLMVVDRNNAGDNFSFAQLGQGLSTLLPPSVSMNTINRANSSDDAALRGQIINAINQGPLMVNYIGHGSVEVWTGSPILSTSDVSSLNNSDQLPVFIMMTCLNGYFQNPSRDSLAEALLRNNPNGAVAVWASSSMTEPNAQAQINQRFYQLVFGKDGLTLGAAAQKAKESTGDLDVRKSWILFGDPTMRIR